MRRRDPILTTVVVATALAAGIALGAVPEGRGMLLPLQDRIGDRFTAEIVTRTLRSHLRAHADLIEPGPLRDALRRLRIRDATGAAPEELDALAERLGVSWFFSGTLHRSQASPEPQITLSAWAYRVGDPGLAWAGFRSASGLDSRRPLDRRRIEALEALAAIAARDLAVDFSEGPGPRAKRPATAPDRGGFLQAPMTVKQLGRLAVLPFAAVSEPDPHNAAETITALARAVLHRRGASVVHPGRVQSILRRHGEGLVGTLLPATRAALREEAGADTILTGTVEAFGMAVAGVEPNPRVAFSARLLDAGQGKILWTHGQDRTGWDRQKLFRRGRIHDPGSLAEQAMQSLLAGMLRPARRKVVDR